MRKFWTYTKYLVRHRWFVMIECWKMGLWWQGLIHDWHKFLPDEFIPYMNKFGGGIQTGRDKTGYYKPEDTGDPAFEVAWFKHQKRSWHHWQSWCSPREAGAGVNALEMPERFTREMVCDWIGAGLAQGKPDIVGWYDKNCGKMKLHPTTRLLVGWLLSERFRQ